MILTGLKQGLAELHSSIRGTSGARAERPSLGSLFSGEGSRDARALSCLLQQVYGVGAERLKPQVIRLTRLCDLFFSLYGDGEVSILRAPARINILGEHVDYVSYLPTASLPFGSREHDMLMLCRASGTRLVRGASTFVGDYPPIQFDFATETFEDGARIEERWLSYLFTRPAPSPGWDNYVKGSVLYAFLKHGDQITGGFDFVIDSSIPPGGGASSSSALIVLTCGRIG